jgi:hypothetical protein
LINTNVEVPLLEALFAVRREAYPRCELEDSESRYPEDGGEMFHRNFGSLYKAARSHIPEEKSFNVNAVKISSKTADVDPTTLEPITSPCRAQKQLEQ